MTEPARDDPALVATPRSALLRALLGTASAAATALIYELVRTLVVDSVGDDPRVKSAIETIFWVPVVLVAAAAAAYVGYRVTRDLRQRLAAARTSDLVADLVPPGPTVAVGATAGVDLTGEVDTLGDDYGWADEAIRVLHALPVRTFRTSALLAMLTAMLEAPARDPDEPKPPTVKAFSLLGALSPTYLSLSSGDQWEWRGRADSLVGPNAPGQRDPRWRGPMWRAALPALLRYHADLAQRWAIALNRPETAVGAARWFAAEADELRTLITSCATGEVATRLEPMLEVIVPELARIADALDSWYATLGLPENVSRHDGGSSSAQAMRDLTTGAQRQPRPEFALWWQLARIRTGETAYGARRLGRRRALRRLMIRRHRYRPREYASSLLARGEHRAALARLSTPGLEAPQPYPPSEPVDRRTALDEIEAQLEHAWWRLPRADVAGEVAALVNLAIVHLHQSRLEAAADRLELAQSLSRAGRDPRGHAHVRETMGALWWARGEPVRALGCWQSGLRAYRALEDDLGIARCLQHLGGAAVVAPELCGELVGGTADSSTTEVLRQATGWLGTAQRLGESGGRPPRYAGHYRDRAVAALAAAPTPVTPLAEVEHWPLADEE
ncbi:hypothetical protein [Nocardia sp. NPDC050406]|uniref:hypothetical protein n=1 Tax=Nocardia sp. NPDC050406 TaxID=3364318 RepID=UPI0037B13213